MYKNAYQTVLKFIDDDQTFIDKFKTIFYKTKDGRFEVDAAASINSFIDHLSDDKAAQEFIRSLVYISEIENENSLFRNNLERAASRGYFPAANLIYMLKKIGIYDSYELIRAYLVYDWSPQS